MVKEPNWWAGQVGPVNKSQAGMKQTVAKDIDKSEDKNLLSEETDYKTFLSTDKSGHYVPDAYQKMLERMKHENPSVEPKKEDVLSRIAGEGKIQNTALDRSNAEPQIRGGSKYIARLRAALQSVIEEKSSVNLVIPIKNITQVEFKKAGKNKDGEIIYEVCENNITLGYSDHIFIR